MRVETISVLRCPAGCGSALCLETGDEARTDVIDGTLLCRECNARYPIEDGIARMLPGWLDTEAELPDDAGHAHEIAHKRSEMAARDAQVDVYDRMRGLALFSRIEIPATLRRLELSADSTLMEVGCGTGRMTPTFAARCKRIIAFDFSFESLKVCRAKLNAAGITNVDLVQADACHLPIVSDVADRVVSCQVLEHIPTPESRDRMVAELTRGARSNGIVVVSAYQHSHVTRLMGDKEGAHEGGIYFFRFHRRELAALLARHLHVESMTGALIYHYLARCRKRDMTEPVLPERKATLRLGQREMSRISLAVILFIVALGGYGVYKFYLSFKSQRDIVINQGNMLAVWKGFQAYAADWGGKMPPAATWSDAISGYVPVPSGTPGGLEGVLHGPSDGANVRYVYNVLAAGYNFERPDTKRYPSPSELVVLIERPGAGVNATTRIPLFLSGNANSEEALARELSFPHYSDDPETATTLVLFADGRISRFQRRDLITR